MRWQETRIAPGCTHHLRGDTPIYDQRFDEVLAFHEPGLAPVRRGRTAWHITLDGSPAYDRRFDRAFGFYEGLAAVVSPEGWHHISTDGADVYQDRYDWCGNYQNGRCTVRDRDGGYFHVTTKGAPAYDARWRYAGDYRDGIAVVQAGNGRSTHVDQQGNLVHGAWFLDLDVFHKGFARARDDDGWVHVDGVGRPIYARRFAVVEPFYNGQARVERFDGGLEVIDERGDRIIELRPALRSEFASLSADLVGFWRTETIGTAVELGVFEALPAPAEGVARSCGLNPSKAQRLLRALTELSLVVERDGDLDTTERGSYLLAHHPLTLADAALEYRGHLSKMWRSLPEALRADSSWRRPDVFAEVAAEPDRVESHHRMLRSYARHDYPEVPAALGLRGDERVIDAGGGLGMLAEALVCEYPDLHVVILDRPEVVEEAARLTVPDRVELRAADIFTPWDVEADAVVMARVLHDWDDEDARRILRGAHQALPAGGRLFVIEMVGPGSGTAGSLCDLHLLAATGGKERTESEFAELFTSADFELEEVRRIAALPSIIVGVSR